MAESWPGGVPSLPLEGTMDGVPFRAPLVTDFEDGNRVQRRSVTKNIATYKYEIIMTNAQYSTFRSWVRDTLVDGSLPFTATVWTGSGAATRTCSFTGPYSDKVITRDHHQVAFELDIDNY